MPLMQSQTNSAIFVDPDSGKSYELVDSYEGSFFDTVYQASGAITAGTELFPFATTNGTNNLPKGRTHTNFTKAKQIPGEHSFIMQRIWVHLLQAFGSVLAEVDDLLWVAYACALEFKLGSRTVGNGPLIFFPSGFGMVGSLSDEGGAVATGHIGTMTNGVASLATVPNSIQPHLVSEKKELDVRAFFPSNAWGSGSVQMPTTTAAMGLMFGMFGLITKSIAA
jgi:hypothetical protein